MANYKTVLRINKGKTKVMHINYHREGAPSKTLEKLEVVEDFKYLGTRLASSLPDFRQRRGIAWNNFWKSQKHLEIYKLTLPEKRPNTELFLVCIFRNSHQKKLQIWTLFTQCCLYTLSLDFSTHLFCPYIYIVQSHGHSLQLLRITWTRLLLIVIESFLTSKELTELEMIEY